MSTIIATNENERKELFYQNLAKTALNATEKLFVELLEAERDEAVGVKRYEQSSKRKDYRNGYTYKWYDTKWGRYRLQIPRTRNSGWTSKIVKKFATMDDELIEIVQYAVFAGISIRLAKPLIELIVGEYISTARISNIIKKIDDDIALWKKSKIESKVYDAIIIDGMWLKLWKGNKKNGKKQENRVAITALAISGTETEILDFEIAKSESEENTIKLLNRLYKRGLIPENIKMFIMEQAKKIFSAKSFDEFIKNVDNFKNSWKSIEYEKKSFENNLEKCGAYLKLELQYRTTSAIENKFRHIRRITRVHGHYVNEKSAERFFYGQLLLRGYIIPYHKLYTKYLT
jgi:transposase-like protein